MRKFYPCLLILFIFYNCSKQKDIVYFQSIKANEQSEIIKFKDAIVQKNDLLDIQLKALDPNTVALFSASENRSQGNGVNPLQGFLVAETGEIKVPLIGLIRAEGFSTSSLETKIEEKIKLYVKNPMVTVRVMNFKVTVLGEVNNPGIQTFLEEGISLPQVLAAAGDLTINGKRDNVTLIRTIGDKKERYYIDLTKEDIFNSPYYYMQQNDIIYVEPNYKKVKSAGLITSLTGVIGVITSLIGIVLILK